MGNACCLTYLARDNTDDAAPVLFNLTLINFVHRVDPQPQPNLMKLPVEVSLHIFGYLLRQALGRIMLANRQLCIIVHRHRKTLNLPEVVSIELTSLCGIPSTHSDTDTAKAVHYFKVPCFPSRRYARTGTVRLV